MNRFITILLASSASIACIAWTLESKSKPKKYEVTGSVLITHDYCGGARPAEDQSSPKPYAAPKGTTLYIRNGAGNSKVIDSITCDSAGNFKITLGPGTYGVYEQWKIEPLVMPVDSKFETWDTACYRYNYNLADYKLVVKGKTKDVKIMLYRHCAWTRPCCTFRGPLPPGAAPTNRSGNQPGHQE